MGKRGVLMVCLGNICRSPISEAVFQHVVKERGLEDKWFVDSAATSNEHTGSPPDRRATACIKRHGIEYKHKCRQLCKDDYKKFHFIFGMDKSNLQDIKRKAPADGTAEIGLLGDYHPDGKTIIHDPWYDSDDKGFEECYEKALASVNAFLDSHQ
ncbi:low molecular weight phosphotyrosine protein phosphatase-like [Panonychus citri]|uniref:low molecular weight phosphotyrosine protein phosphatase-like n=1 Tax=Panonychus citri TaxID=50023 RepID=UPI00230720C1|nr:low molecular weight phosphotyrosine protein phosphatase-like [Panonychus citri]